MFLQVWCLLRIFLKFLCLWRLNLREKWRLSLKDIFFLIAGTNWRECLTLHQNVPWGMVTTPSVYTTGTHGIESCCVRYFPHVDIWICVYTLVSSADTNTIGLMPSLALSGLTTDHLGHCNSLIPGSCSKPGLLDTTLTVSTSQTWVVLTYYSVMSDQLSISLCFVPPSILREVVLQVAQR